MPSSSFDHLMDTLSRGDTQENIVLLEKYLHAYDRTNAHPGLKVRLLVNGVEKLPEPVQEKLYSFLCDEDNPLRKVVGSTLAREGASYATTALIGGLGLALTGPVGLVAGIAVKMIADSATEDSSEEIEYLRAERMLEQLKKEQPHTAVAKTPVKTIKSTATVKEKVSPAKKKRTAAPEITDGAEKKPARKNIVSEPQPALHKTVVRSTGEIAHPIRGKAAADGLADKKAATKETKAKKTSAAASKAEQHPTPSAKTAKAMTAKPSQTEQPSEKSVPKAKSTPLSKPASSTKTAKKEKSQ